MTKPIKAAFLSLLASIFSVGSLQSVSAERCQEVMYQIVTDRFFDGNANNNNPAQSSGLYSSVHNGAPGANWKNYWGGDFSGIESKLDYLKNMGVTALWISPVIDNINVRVGSPSEGQASGYHGYWARDFSKLEEHFSDAAQNWTSFDSLIRSAHSKDLKVYVDFAPNHTSPRVGGNDAPLFDQGTLVERYSTDSRQIFHRNSNLDGADYQDRYKVQYHTLSDLADLNQQNAFVDSYLRRCARQLQAHGVDGFRLDTLKHTNWGWQYSLASDLLRSSKGRANIFGEWWIDNGNHDSLYFDAVKFSKRSGINLLNFPLKTAITKSFAGNESFFELDKTLTYEDRDFSYPEDLVNFIDNHDDKRFLSINNNRNKLDLALAFLITSPGIPCIYYGTEQYLFNNGFDGNHAENAGKDPYNRPMMQTFDSGSIAYQIVSRLAPLRKKNLAIAYGSTKQLWINDDVYVYQRRYGSNVLVTAINKSTNPSPLLENLVTALPCGVFSDELGGLKRGQQLRILTDGKAMPLSLPPESVSVWSYIQPTPNLPQVTATRPRLAQRGEVLTLYGRGFGNVSGTVRSGNLSLQISSWNDEEIEIALPLNLQTGKNTFKIGTADGASVEKTVDIVNSRLSTVTFTVRNVPPTSFGDEVYLSGSCFELGNWTSDRSLAVGPLLNPQYPNWFISAAVPSGELLQFKLLKIKQSGEVVWEGGANHVLAVPNEGVGFVDVNWQN